MVVYFTAWSETMNWTWARKGQSKYCFWTISSPDRVFRCVVRRFELKQTRVRKLFENQTSEGELWYLISDLKFFAFILLNHLLSLCMVISYGKMSDLSFCADLIKTNTLSRRRAGVMLSLPHWRSHWHKRKSVESGALPLTLVGLIRWKYFKSSPGLLSSEYVVGRISYSRHCCPVVTHKSHTGLSNTSTRTLWLMF